MSLILVVARLQAKPGKRDELIDVVQEAVGAIRQEPGCITYAMHQDLVSENDFVFVEEWQDLDALRQHTGSANMESLGQGLANLLAGAPEVRVHTVESSQDLADITDG
jgi:quinol monooxygenase YgiN